MVTHPEIWVLILKKKIPLNVGIGIELPAAHPQPIQIRVPPGDHTVVPGGWLHGGAASFKVQGKPRVPQVTPNTGIWLWAIRKHVLHVKNLTFS